VSTSPSEMFVINVPTTSQFTDIFIFTKRLPSSVF
jgi:hypothetical protein